MRVTANAVRNNWQYNFALGAILFIWLLLACMVLFNPKGAMHVAAQFGKLKGTESPWMLVILSLVPSFLLALPFAFIGRVLGISAASRILAEHPEKPAAGDFSSARFSSKPASGARDLQSEQWMARSWTPPSSPSPEAPPSGRGIGSFVLRTVLGVLWMVGFFVAGSFALSAVVLALATGDQETRQTAVEAAGRAGGVPLFFGSIFLVVVLAILGWLPGFRRRKTAPPTEDTALPRSNPLDSRPIIAR
jgi:hypothetical protein